MPYNIIDVSNCCGECINAFFYYEIVDKETSENSVRYTITYYVECDDVPSPVQSTFFDLACGEEECITLTITTEFCTFEVRFGNSPTCTCDPCVGGEVCCQAPVGFECCFACTQPYTFTFGNKVYTGNMVCSGENALGFEIDWTTDLPSCIESIDAHEIRISFGLFCATGIMMTGFYIVRDINGIFIEYGSIPGGAGLGSCQYTRTTDECLCQEFTWTCWEPLNPYSVSNCSPMSLSVGTCGGGGGPDPV
jgi:hypothetical protein